MATTYLTVLEQLTGLLTTASVATPLISGAIMSIAAIIRGVTASGPSLREVADMIERQLAANDTAGKAEIARLKALLGNDQ